MFKYRVHYSFIARGQLIISCYNCKAWTKKGAYRQWRESMERRGVHGFFNLAARGWL